MSQCPKSIQLTKYSSKPRCSSAALVLFADLCSCCHNFSYVQRKPSLGRDKNRNITTSFLVGRERTESSDGSGGGRAGEFLLASIFRLGSLLLVFRSRLLQIWVWGCDIYISFCQKGLAIFGEKDLLIEGCRVLTSRTWCPRTS
jgi:hypothetical protein